MLHSLKPLALPSNFKLRPSAAGTWVKCAGAPSLSIGAPAWVDDDEDQVVREDGTACHWLAHQLSQGIKVQLGALAPNGVAVDEEMFEAVEMYFEAIRRWGVEAYFELPVVCRRVSLECGGTVDVGAYCPTRRTIFVGDLKYGFRFVDVVRNWQLLCYFTGMQDHVRIFSDVDLWVEFLIVQPRSYHRDGPVRTWRVHATELRAYINILTNAAERALQLTPPCTVNPGCKRCPGRTLCDTARNSGLEGIETSFDAIPHALPFAAAEDELRRLQAAKDIIEARITGLEQQVIHGMRTGQSSARYAMESTPGRKVWTEEGRAIIQNIATLYGADITKDSLITPTQAAKKLPAVFIDKYSHRPGGAMKLVPIETSRIARQLGKST